MRNMILMLLLLIPLTLFSATRIIDPNHCIMTTKPIGVQNTPQGLMEVMPIGLLPLIYNYSVVYPNAVNPKASTSCTLRLTVTYGNITTVRTYLQANGIDSGAVTTTAYTLSN